MRYLFLLLIFYYFFIYYRQHFQTGSWEKYKTYLERFNIWSCLKLNVTVGLLLFFLCVYRYMIYPLIVHYSPFQTGYFLFAFKCTGNNLKWKSGYISYILFVFQLYFPLLLLLLVFHLFFLERNKALEASFMFVHACHR